MKLVDRLKLIPEMLLDDRNRFWSFVSFKGPDDCWEYKGCRNSKGYGNFSLKDEGYKSNRIAWFLTYGEPGKLFVLHECNNPPCCNPKHLYLGTNADNVKHAILDGRMNYSGELSNRAKFDNKQVIKIRQRFEKGESITLIARSLDVHPTTVHKIVNFVSYERVN